MIKMWMRNPQEDDYVIKNRNQDQFSDDSDVNITMVMMKMKMRMTLSLWAGHRAAQLAEGVEG